MLNVPYIGRIARILILCLLLLTIVTILYMVLSMDTYIKIAPAHWNSRGVIADDDTVSPENNASSFRKLIAWTEKRGSKSNVTWGRTISTGVKMAPGKTIVNVGFFEGYRVVWNYPTLFQPPPSPRTCECFNRNEVKFYANVTLEKDESLTGMFEVLFFPQDVSFMHIEPSMWDTILRVSTPKQRRIYATFECAFKLKFLALDPPYNKKIFHWSLTHHSQSDFTMPYGYYRPFSKQRPTSGPQKNWAEGRKGLVAWMSTWSVTTWNRETFVQNLKKHVSVDIFGEKKGRKPCPRNSTQCEQKMRTYKFYLALENSCCSEYISEKFWRTLAWDVVPIVVGASRESYERLAPPNSFIYADDFTTIEDLAQYIIKLDKNNDLYIQYFLWKEKGEVFINYPNLQSKLVTSRVPPSNFFYSCNSVCKASEKYLDEKQDTDVNSGETFNNSSANSFFDPNVSWWCGSCTKCGEHTWIRKLNTA